MDRGVIRCHRQRRHGLHDFRECMPYTVFGSLVQPNIKSVKDLVVKTSARPIQTRLRPDIGVCCERTHQKSEVNVVYLGGLAISSAP